MELPDDARGERYCYLTTSGRVTGRRHTAELWFLPADGGIWMMSGSGGLTTWCRNLQVEEQGVLKIAGRSWLVRAAELPMDADAREEVLRRFHRKYDPPGKDRTPYWVKHATVMHLVLLREV